jgi:hypothetical protein
MNLISHNYLVSRVDQAIKQFYRNDMLLLDFSASEWSIAHRIAVYLEKGFKGWNVDCEYNRTREDCSIKQNAEGKNKRPDIVVHHRGKVEIEHNLLVIEIKTSGSNHDFKKLKDYTNEPNMKRPFQYQYGLALSFIPNLSLQWFHKGEKLV